MNSGGSGPWRSRRRREAIPKADEPDLTRRGIDQNIGRLQILVNQLLFVQPAKCCCETDGEAQELLTCPQNPSTKLYDIPSIVSRIAFLIGCLAT